MMSLKSPNLENTSTNSIGRIISSQSLKKLQILVVDDDSTSLAIVSSMLKNCSLQDCMIELSVVTVKNSLDALSTLRAEKGAFDLVITDLNIPGMNGLELQKQVNEEFKIPVIIMSLDDKEGEILKSIESGDVFYMMKPVNPDDLKIVWQYAVASKKGKGVVIDQEIASAEGETSSYDKFILRGEAISYSSVNEETRPKKKKGRKRARDQSQPKEDAAPPPPKKAKVVWTDTLHNRFLQAISHIGLEKAFPKKILEFMEVPGLTRDNVASHLQKYRMFLKKVAEKGFQTSSNLAESALRSSFACGYTSMFKNAQQEYSLCPVQKPFTTSSFRPGYGGNLCGLSGSSFSGSSFGLSSFSNQEASSSNSVPQLSYGQSSLSGNPTSFLQRSLTFANPYQANRSTSNNTGVNLSSNMATAYGPTSGASPMQMHPQQSQANLQNSFGTRFKIDSTGIVCSNSSSVTGSMGTINSPCISLNHSSNYAGIRLTSEGNKLIGTGKTQFNGNGLSIGSRNGGGSGMTPGNIINNIPTGNGTFGGLGAQGAGSSSTGFGNTSQFSPTFIATNQVNVSVLPPEPQQQTSISLANTGGENDYAFNNLMTNASTLDSIYDNQQELGEGDLGELLFGSPYTNPYQLQGRNETATPDLGGNVNPVDDYYPSFEQPQCNNLEPSDSELNSLHLDEELISGYESWGEDFWNSLLNWE